MRRPSTCHHLLSSYQLRAFGSVKNKVFCIINRNRNYRKILSVSAIVNIVVIPYFLISKIEPCFWVHGTISKRSIINNILFHTCSIAPQWDAMQAAWEYVLHVSVISRTEKCLLLETLQSVILISILLIERLIRKSKRMPGPLINTTWSVTIYPNCMCPSN